MRPFTALSVVLVLLAGCVQTLEHTELRTSRWVGEWVRDENASIRITDDSGDLHIEGEAAWWPTGRHPPDGVPNVGYVQGKILPLGNRVRYADDGCEVELGLLRGRLMVTDNSSCGGANVSFNGTYHRRHRSAFHP